MGHPTHRNDTTHRGLVPTDQLGTGTANASMYLRGDQTWQAGVGGRPLMVKDPANPVWYVLTDGDGNAIMVS